MTEYISREAVLAEIEWCKDEFCECEYAFKALENNLPLPAADVIEAVRCKDCVWSQDRWQPQSAPEGWHYCADIDISTPKDFYCAFGEKRQESEGKGDV